MAFEFLPCTTADLPEVLALFRDTIQRSCATDYTQEQLDAWKDTDEANWVNRVETQHFVLARQGGKLAGIASLLPPDYLDVLYVSADFQGQGLAKLLLEDMEVHAIAQGAQEIVTDGSITAKPFFLKMGFEVVREQQPSRNGISLTNYRMVKQLP